MMTMELPPQLSDLHSQLSSSKSPHAQHIRSELEIVGELVQHVRASNPQAPALQALDKMLKKGFTGGPLTTCLCCGRPF
jgi:hypothetical protein